MHSALTSQPGCGSPQCQCKTADAAVARINGIALHLPGQSPDADSLRELAYTELLRQQAIHAGLLPSIEAHVSPQLGEAERQVLETLVESAVAHPEPTEEECRRYFDAHQAQFVVGQALHVRHILFAVTPGVNVHALAIHAEKALISLLGKDVPAGRFEQLAREMSNCPTSTQGGDLGWVGPQDCAPELANELFHQKQAGWGMGVHPRLVHTRFGFHIIEVLGRRKGKQLTFEQVRQRVADQLSLQSRARAMHQYMSLLAGQAQVEGVELNTADSPLVQ